MNTDFKFFKRILSEESAVSLVALIITIIVIIILAAISIFYTFNTADKANQATFVNELSNVQEHTNVKRTENEKLDINDKNYGFNAIKVINKPNEFENVVDDEDTYGYMIDLDYIGMNGANFGREYKTLDYTSDEVIFGVTDVYIYDKYGVVYYVRGFKTEDGVIYRIGESSTFSEPVIESVSYLLHTSKHKAMISIEAYSRTNSNITVTVGGELAGYEQGNKYYIEKTQNGTYDIWVEDEYGNKAYRTIVITGIVPEGEEVIVTPPEITSITLGEQVKRKILINASAIDSDDGITGYAFSYGNVMPSSEWVSVEKTKSEIKVSHTADKTGEYYFWVRNSENIFSSQAVYVEINTKIFSITYDTGAGKWADGISRDTEKEDDNTIKITSDRPVRAGFTFKGWTTIKGSNTVEYMPGASYNQEADLKLYAIWSANTNTKYVVEHYKENVDGTYSVANTDNLVGTTNTLVIANERDYPHYKLNDKHSGMKKQGYIEGDGSLVLKLYYERESYIVALTGDGTQNGGGSYKFGKDVSISATANRGYEFKNWQISSGSASLASSKSASTHFIMPAENVSIDATYEIITYSITYELNGGTVSKSNPKKYTVIDDIKLNNPEKDGYRFIGWSGTDISDKQKDVTIRDAIGNRTYTANYVELFTLTSLNETPTYNSVKVRVTSVDNVKFEYSIDNGKTWTSISELNRIKSDEYTSDIEIFDNLILKVRALKNDKTVECEKEIKISNILKESEANEPILKDGMRAVYYNDNGEQELNSFTSNMYNYTAKSNSELESTESKWANAKTNDGSYFVWIPRYAYKVEYYTDATRQKISDKKTDYEKVFIIFMSGNSSTTYKLKGTSQELELPKDYTVPSAFSYNEKELDGIWVAKYEMSYEGKNKLDTLITLNTSLSGGNVKTINAGNLDNVKVVSKPNLRTWRGISYNNAINNSKNMYEEYNSSLTSYNEWRAIAILTHSPYGINTKEISKVTGYKANLGESTTGNTSGVYGLNNDTWEYVISNENTEELNITNYLNPAMNNEYYKEAINNKIVGATLDTSIPVDGSADARVGYRVVLHVEK